MAISNRLIPVQGSSRVDIEELQWNMIRTQESRHQGLMLNNTTIHIVVVAWVLTMERKWSEWWWWWWGIDFKSTAGQTTRVTIWHLRNYRMIMEIEEDINIFSSNKSNQAKKYKQRVSMQQGIEFHWLLEGMNQASMVKSDHLNSHRYKQRYILAAQLQWKSERMIPSITAH